MKMCMHFVWRGETEKDGKKEEREYNFDEDTTSSMALIILPFSKMCTK